MKKSSKMYSPKNILISGSAGFIGSNFVRFLLSHDPFSKVISIDKLTYASSVKNLQNIDETNHKLIIGDITDSKLISKILKENNINTIIHFAAESHVDRSIVSPRAFIDSNIVGTFVLLEEARQFWLNENNWNDKNCRFHHISTDEVYGSLHSSDPAFTEFHAYKPNSPYSATKAAADHLVRAYYHTYGLPITISNCSNNYGPNQHNEKFIPTVINACINMQPIAIYGSGLNIRDWLFVDDHAEAIDLIVKNAITGSTYNIGGRSEKSNLEVAQAICDRMDELYPRKKSYSKLITFVNDRLGHDWRYAINIDKIKKELGWEPRVGFEEGLSITINHYIDRHLSSLKKNEIEVL